MNNDDLIVLKLFFEEFQTPDDVRKYVVNIINEVKAGSTLEGETGSDSGIAVWIKSDFTKLVDFYGSRSYLTPDLTLPTSDFEALATAWKDFVQS